MDSGKSMEIGGMWNLKHDIRSPRLYELIIKTELKVDTAMELKNFYNHIKMCPNTVTRHQEDILPGYHSINRHSDFSEYFNPDRDNPYYYWNVQIYTPPWTLTVSGNN